jgi:hypothetical protein
VDILITGLAIILLVGSIIGPIMGNMIASELYDCAPSIARWLLKKAVARLPEQQRQRYHEEWHAHLEECPGKLGKLWHAFGCAYSSSKLAVPSLRPLGRILVPLSVSVFAFAVISVHVQVGFNVWNEGSSFQNSQKSVSSDPGYVDTSGNNGGYVDTSGNNLGYGVTSNKVPARNTHKGRIGAYYDTSTPIYVADYVSTYMPDYTNTYVPAYVSKYKPHM